MFGITGRAESMLVSEGAKFIGTGSSVLGSAVSSVAAPIAAQFELMATPLFFISILSLAKTGVDLVFGNTEGRIFVPVVLMLNQRIAMGAQEMKLEEFY